MSNWPIIGPASSIKNPASISATSLNQTIPHNNVWTEISSSWPGETNQLHVSYNHTTPNRTTKFQIGIGGSGSEIVILDLPFANYGGSNGLFQLPCNIPVGSRVSARSSNGGAHNVQLQLIAWQEPYFGPGFTSGTLMGWSSNSVMTSLDAGATLNTKGAYAQIIASTAEAYKGILLNFGNSGSTDTTSVSNLLDLAIGAAASEIVILPDYHIQRAGRGVGNNTSMRYIPIHIPAGVRLAARIQADNNTVGQRDLLDISVLGLF